MSDSGVVIVGGGSAGLATAGVLVRAGVRTTVVEQRATLGGAFHRQPAGAAKPVAISASARRRFEGLMRGISSPLLRLRTSSIFLGVDGDHNVLVEDRALGVVEKLRAGAIILAVGAVEKVSPVPGWELPGVSTAGGLQVMMKETGMAPEGRVLLAGNGPLLVALAAQMIRLGHPPVAIVEAGNPVAAPFEALGLLAHAGLLREAAGYAFNVLTSSVPWKRASRLVRIDRADGRLAARVRHAGGHEEVIVADRIALHDGIRENDIGLPSRSTDRRPFILRAGDCRQALGVLAAVADGERAGAEAAALLSGCTAALSRFEQRIGKQIAAQALLARLFAPVIAPLPLADLPDEAVLCRCEGRTVGDLRALLAVRDGLSGREVKHNGRFAMGSCQGRFCAANTAALMAKLRPDMPTPRPEDLTGRRWPVRPVSISALVGATSDHKTNDQEVKS